MLGDKQEGTTTERGSNLLAGIPVLGSLISGFIQRDWAKRDREYNSPKNQVARLREAGLPLASMFSGGAGGQTQTRGSELDPSLGTAQGLDKYFTNRMTRKQLQLMDEQIGKAEADKVIAQVAANKALDEDRFYRQPKFDKDGYLVEGSRREDSLGMQMRQQEAATRTSEILAKFQEAKSQAELDHIKQTIKLGVQQYQYNEIIKLVDKWIVGKLSQKGLTALEAMLYKAFLSKGNFDPTK